MDECLASVTSEEETVGLDRDLVSIRSKGGLELMKCINNNQAVMAAIPEGQRAKGIK